MRTLLIGLLALGFAACTHKPDAKDDLRLACNARKHLEATLSGKARLALQSAPDPAPAELQYLAAQMKTEAGRKLLADLTQAAPREKPHLLRERARSLGLAGCPLADEWDQRFANQSAQLSFESDLRLICEAPSRLEAGQDAAARKAFETAPDQPARELEFLREQVQTEKGRQLLARLTHAAPQAAPDVLRSEAARAGLGKCRLAEDWAQWVADHGHL